MYNTVNMMFTKSSLLPGEEEIVTKRLWQKIHWTCLQWHPTCCPRYRVGHVQIRYPFDSNQSKLQRSVTVITYMPISRWPPAQKPTWISYLSHIICYNNISTFLWRSFHPLWWQKRELIFTCHEGWTTLQWRHNERGGVSNQQPHDCLLNRLFSRRSRETSKLSVTGLCAGN